MSGELKSDLEREARWRKIPLSSVLDLAVRDWLKKSRGDAAGDDTQRALHADAERCVGAFSGGNSRRAESARKAVRDRMQRRRRARAS